MTFSEALGRLPRQARRTVDVTAMLLWVVNAAGGERGARLANAMGVPTSADTLLRVQRAAGLMPSPTPRVLGIDDLALRRGHHYATLFVDMETRRPIDVVHGRDAAVLEAWLRAHPGVEVIVRDRAEAYADGAKAGAPEAVQVADRFHLVQNASTALEEMLRGRRRALADGAPDPRTAGTVTSAPTRPVSATARRLVERRAARLARWEMVHTLRAQGLSLLRIATESGMGRQTVRGLLASPVPPRNQQIHPRPPPLSSPPLGPFAPYLQDRWQAGAHNVSQLIREIVAQGYTGGASRVRQAIATWRPPRRRRHRRPPAARDRRRLTIRWLCLRSPDSLDDDARATLTRVLGDDPGLATGYDLLHRFRRLVAARDHAGLDPWLADARASGLAPFESLAKGLAADRAAVAAALTMPWSNGPVEGHINRVKLIKRAGYGRAKLDLLRVRILLAA